MRVWSQVCNRDWLTTQRVTSSHTVTPSVAHSNAHAYRPLQPGCRSTDINVHTHDKYLTASQSAPAVCTQSLRDQCTLCSSVLHALPVYRLLMKLALGVPLWRPFTYWEKHRICIYIYINISYIYIKIYLYLIISLSLAGNWGRLTSLRCSDLVDAVFKLMSL